ncbi:dephospho-CoA kinase [bacterium]|nr:dephospho-CoA kinase [bacterium]
MLKKIAVTGGIASGKTTVCQFFKELGASVIFADQIVHDLLEGDLGRIIIQEFGTKIVKNGQIDRKALADLAFKDPNLLKKLEERIHPAVLSRIDEEYAKAKGTCFIAEIPLLYEIGADDSYNAVIAVVTDEEIAKKRFKQGEAEYELRMSRQLKPQEKASRAQYVLRNNGTLDELRQQVKKLHEHIVF